MESDRIDLLKLMRLFRRKLWLIFLLGVVGIVVSGSLTAYLIPRLYSADVLMYIWRDEEEQSANVMASDLNLFTQLVSDYQVLVKSRLVTEKVVQDLQLPSVAALASQITVGTKTNTRYITLTVKDEDPNAAALIANKVAEVFSQTVVDKMGAGKVQIIDAAIVPGGPSSPNLKINITLGALIGLMLAAGFILLLELLDTAVRTVDDVAELTGFMLLSTIPGFQTNRHGHRKMEAQMMETISPATVIGLNENDRYSLDLVTHYDQLSSASEAFKVARTNIEFSSIDSRLKSLMITSSGQAEGKTVTISNLAIAYAQIGRKVLLIDADLRRPAVHRCFGYANRRGLTNVLIGVGHYNEYVMPTLTKNLAILPAGPIPPNPADLLMSQTMSDLIQELEKEYDLVLVDCPPVGAVTDAAIISTKVDATIFVVRAGLSNKQQLKRSVALLHQVNARVLGYVMNEVGEDSDDRDYTYQKDTQSGQQVRIADGRKHRPASSRRQKKYKAEPAKKGYKSTAAPVAHAPGSQHESAKPTGALVSDDD